MPLLLFQKVCNRPISDYLTTLLIKGVTPDIPAASVPFHGTHHLAFSNCFGTCTADSVGCAPEHEQLTCCQRALSQQHCER